ncbi:MAG TPA: energy transducer TonB [Pelobium sp.]|nr:energy transducer TonB [Pelobium sp.]
MAGLFISSTLFAQTKEEIGTKLSIVEALPQFPGGYDAFGKYISKSLNYPEIARIIGIDGKVIISFVIDKNGRLVDIEPKSCLGAGCEAEAQRILENSPIWKPGFQDGKAVRVQYTLPISFNNPKPKFTIDELKKSTFNFVFLLKDKEYSLTDCEALKIKKFKSEWVETSMLHPEQNKFTDSEKRETYILKIKDTSYDEFFANNSSL